jgi:mono/diheme cytochrome c family protein
MGSFEWIRESVRRPFLIYNYLYSNAIYASNLNQVNAQGILKSARWSTIKEINSNNALSAGKEIFHLACASCHSINGPMNNIMPLTKKFSVYGMQSTLDGMGKLNHYMPVFPGTDIEKTALSRYIVERLHKNQEEPQSEDIETELLFEKPDYNSTKDLYILLSWNSKGVHFFSDSDTYFSLSPPGNTLYASLIKKGEIPERIVDDIEITYTIEKGFEQPSKWVLFWEFSKSLIGRNLEKDTGASGNKTIGAMKLDENDELFYADHIPVVPYTEDGSFNPYPLITIEATNKRTGQIVATTKTVAPASTEMGCKNCHGGEWKFANVTGIGNSTGKDILAMHDKNSHTNLKKLAKRGKPVSCKSCHKDPDNGKESDILNLSAAMHGWHANYLPNQGADACYNCHPDSPDGSTQSFRGFHADIFECISCHGAMEDHALSLLKSERNKNKNGAKRLMKHLEPQMTQSVGKINPREPWVNEPDCLNCHVDFQLPVDVEEFIAFNQWTKTSTDLFRHRKDDMEAMNCSACHGSPHAIYPAINIFGNNRDNIQPMQYQKNTNTLGSSNCKPCHTVPMADEAHHPNSKK